MSTKKIQSEELLNADILARYNNLNRTIDLNGFDIVWPIDRNFAKLKIAVKSNKILQEIQIPKLPAYLTYEQELGEMFKTLAKKEDGTTAIKVQIDWDGSEREVYDVDVKSEKYLDAKATLNAKHSAALDARDKQFKAYSEFLEQPFKGEIKFHFISESTLKESNPGINHRVLSLISWMILPNTEE